eukprot:TRINITY_DN67852_c5_g11_i1.p1 TRINITY_DN67852_c5_g11~~TRINITY_DN67852_c5_g11_i1.p1  ORF type:complete len:331 (+),score=33.49 TRINITY_DN67852_c5_g11_i1:97-1089(+)
MSHYHSHQQHTGGWQTPSRGGSFPRRSTSPINLKKEYETDPHRLAQRQKQIAMGEATPGHRNFLKLLKKDPTLLHGCIPVKPSINQKCSKRSWDGQIKKWRRGLHMYDFVDFGDDEEQSQEVRKALIEQNKNPLFCPETKKTLVIDGTKCEVPIIPPAPNLVTSAGGDVKLPPNADYIHTTRRVRYTPENLLRLADSTLVAEMIPFPENLAWLDKRFDLEDEDRPEDLFEMKFTAPPKATPKSPVSVEDKSPGTAATPVTSPLLSESSKETLYSPFSDYGFSAVCAELPQSPLTKDEEETDSLDGCEMIDLKFDFLDDFASSSEPISCAI